MSTKNNPGAFRCFEAALPDEPNFTLLARDPAAPATVDFWVEERKRQDKNRNPDDRDRIDDALKLADSMEVWREKNLDPLGDGSGPSWQHARLTDDGSPIRALPGEVQYIPAERDGDAAVRLNIEWLKARVADLVEGNMDRPGFAALIETACEAPDRRPVSSRPPATKAETEQTEERLENAIISLRDGRVPTPHTLYRLVSRSQGWSYEAIGFGVDDLEDLLVLLKHKRALAGLPQPGAETAGEQVVVDTHPTDIAHAPEVPPHRFSQFHKGEHYAYARGLEINPSHLPTALDAMERDGWSLLAIFGQTDSQHVGFIFKRTAAEQ